MSSGPGRRPIVLLGGIAVAAYALAMAVGAVPGAFVALRLLLMVLAALVVIRMVANPLLLVSPISWLGPLHAVAFVAMPMLFLWLRAAPPHQVDWYMGRVATYVGSPAEALVIHWAAALLALSAMLPNVDGGLQLTRLSRHAAWLVAAAVVGLAAVSASGYPQLKDVSLPLMVVGCVVLVAGHRHFGVGPGLLALTAAIAAGLAQASIKLPLYALLPSAVVLTPVSARMRRVAVIAVVGVLPALMAGKLALTSSYAESMGQMVEYKLLARQSETAFCFSQVVAQHWPGNGGGGPFDFLAGLVPRIVWSEKPSLSLGTEYALRYCAMSVDPANPHSASITLIGEPVARAGLYGLLVAEGILLLVLLAASRAAARWEADGGMLVLAALLPWLIDIDLSTSMYFARAVKSALIIGFAVAVLGLWQKRCVHAA